VGEHGGGRRTGGEGGGRRVEAGGGMGRCFLNICISRGDVDRKIFADV